MREDETSLFFCILLDLSSNLGHNKYKKLLKIETRSTGGETAAINQYLDELDTKNNVVTRYDGYKNCNVSNDYYSLSYSGGWILTLNVNCFDTQTWQEIPAGTKYNWAYSKSIKYWFLME